ncbi:hypothetical protein LJR027_003872 [Terrabacter sp. LjRoot27]|uniref:HIT family protein n=1 Tax=Terrabacter sp. LjRoot27 TaxID=3342306 RepID=UPI003ECF580D
MTTRTAPAPDLVPTSFDTLPWSGPLTSRAPSPRIVPEPPRRGEPGGEECGVCSHHTSSSVWSDEHWTLHPAVGGSLPGTVWLASREHVDSLVDLPAAVAASFGLVLARVERAILALGDVGRVHVYRWGDGGAHFHVWLMPRPLGMLDANGPMLPLWEDVLPNISDEAMRESAERVAAAMESTS